MEIKEIKDKMINYRDYFGGQLLESEKILTANTKIELAEIIERHHSHLEDMLTDAQSNLKGFKHKLGLSGL